MSIATIPLTSTIIHGTNNQSLCVQEKLGLGKDFKHPTEIQTKAMTTVSIENKWAMVCQHKETEKDTKKLENSPQYWSR